LNLKKHGHMCPKQQKKHDNSKKNILFFIKILKFSNIKLDIQIAKTPFEKSPIKVNNAGKNPKLRSIFENPALLLPKLLISFF